jgi:hypothetical protein
LQQIYDLVVGHLTDPQIEVRELTKASLSSVLQSTATQVDIPALIRRFRDLAGNPTEKRRSMPQH